MPTSAPSTPLLAATRAETDLELAARLRVAIARLSRQLRQQAGSSLSPTLQSVLASIALHGPLSLGDLAVREQVAPPTITKLLGRLDEQGLIERQRGADDRRVILVSLTAEGHRQLEESRNRRTAWLERRLGELDVVDESQLLPVVELLEAIVDPAMLGLRPTSSATTPAAAVAEARPGASDGQEGVAAR